MSHCPVIQCHSYVVLEQTIPSHHVVSKKKHQKSAIIFSSRVTCSAESKEKQTLLARWSFFHFSLLDELWSWPFSRGSKHKRKKKKRKLRFIIWSGGKSLEFTSLGRPWLVAFLGTITKRWEGPRCALGRFYRCRYASLPYASQLWWGDLKSHTYVLTFFSSFSEGPSRVLTRDLRWK